MDDLYRKYVFPVLVALSVGDAERAHTLARWGISALQRVPPLLLYINERYYMARHDRSVTIAGTRFPNRVGLAAGLDKQGEMLPFWQALGFGFVTVGTVLPQRQQGSPRPRLFRLRDIEALINRMGFNSDGMIQVLHHLDRDRKSIIIPLGVSAGKMAGTPLDDAVEDYVAVMRTMWLIVTYIEICISSPNTPDLRKLQGRKYVEAFLARLHGVRGTCRDFSGVDRPLFLKIAPDMTLPEVDDILAAIGPKGARKVDGMIISNTTVDRSMIEGHPLASEKGGLSGPPVYEKMMALLKYVRSQDDEIPIIAVGGINTPEKGQQAFDEGANAIQILTGFVYRGPQLVQDLRALP